MTLARFSAMCMTFLFAVSCGSSGGGSDGNVDGGNRDTNGGSASGRHGGDPRTGMIQEVDESALPEALAVCEGDPEDCPDLAGTSRDFTGAGLQMPCDGQVVIQTAADDELQIRVCRGEIEKAYRGSILFEAVNNLISIDSAQIRDQLNNIRAMCRAQTGPQGQTGQSFVNNYKDLAILRELLARMGDINAQSLEAQKASFRNFLRLQTLVTEYTVRILMPTIEPTQGEKQRFYDQNSEQLNQLNIPNAELQELITEGVRRQRVNGIFEEHLEQLREARRIMIDEVAMTITIDNQLVVDRPEAQAAYRTQLQLSGNGMTQSRIEEISGDPETVYDFLNQYVYYVLMRQVLQQANLYDQERIEATVEDMVEMFTMLWLRQRGLQYSANKVTISGERINEAMSLARDQYPDASDSDLQQAVRQQLLQIGAQEALNNRLRRWKDSMRLTTNTTWCQ